MFLMGMDIEVLHVAHSMLELDKREIVFSYKEEELPKTIGLKYDLSKEEDRVQYQQIGWLADVLYYEEELRGKRLRAIVELSNGENIIRALGHKDHDCFLIVNGNNEIMPQEKCEQQLLSNDR